MPQSALIAALAVANLVVTFGYQWLPIATLGVGSATDALFVSGLVPQMVLAVVGANLTSVLTPQLSISTESSFHVQAWTFAQGLALGAVAINGLLLLSAPIWVHVIVPGFDAPTRALTLDLLRVQLLGAVFTMLLMVSWSASYARHEFLRVEATGTVAGLIGLVGAWLALPRYGVHAVAWALALRAALQVLFLLPALGRYSRPDWTAAGGAETWRRLVPLMGGAMYFKADPLVERMLASFAPAGHLSLLHLAQQAYGAGNQILTRALINPIMPALARHAAAPAWAEFRALVRRRLALVVGLAGAAWLLLTVAGRPVMQLALSRWLAPADVDLLHALLVALAGVGLGAAAGQVLTVAFYAYGNTVTPTRVGVIGFTLAIPLKALFFWWWGVLGIAVATSIYTMGNACAHGLLLRRDVGRLSRPSTVVAP